MSEQTTFTVYVAVKPTRQWTAPRSVEARNHLEAARKVAHGLPSTAPGNQFLVCNDVKAIIYNKVIDVE